MPSDRRNSGADRSAAGLDLRGLRRVFHGQPVIEDLSLDVRPGEFLALLGPSGCGKSTLLRLIAGLDPPDGGEIAITGAGPSLAYVFQDASLMPWRTVLGNVVLPLELAGQPRGEREAAARALLDAVGLSSAAPRYPGELSGGMKMRVSLARALITRPALLLLDEPFAALDEFTRQRLDEHLQHLWLDRRMTVVFVTHSLMEAVFLADRVVVLAPQGGRIQADQPITLPRPRARATRTGAPCLALMDSLARALDTTTSPAA